MEVVFFEKPGCAGNTKQKTLLDIYNIHYKTEDILSYPWRKEFLKEFFENVSKEDIYNPFAPQIKSKEIKPQTLTKDQLIELMLKTPILIKRPLLIVEGHKLCGFDIEQINQLCQKNICTSVSISTCQSETCKK